MYSAGGTLHRVAATSICAGRRLSSSNCDVRTSVQARRPNYARCYALSASSHQSHAVGKRVGTCIVGVKVIDRWEDCGGIGARELYGTVNNRVPVSADHRGDRDGDG